MAGIADILPDFGNPLEQATRGVERELLAMELPADTAKLCGLTIHQIIVLKHWYHGATGRYAEDLLKEDSYVGVQKAG